MDGKAINPAGQKPGGPCPAGCDGGRIRWVENGEVKEKACGVCHGTGRQPVKTTK